ncbi:MAG: hypothetical protein U0Z17_05475 [Bacteroidales bacterium]
MIKNILATGIIVLIGIAASAQEMLTTPLFNPLLTQQAILKSASSIAPGPISLPFYDDFSVNTVYPSPLKWTDRYAFVNTDFAKYPPSVGVVTLDALDDKGALYPEQDSFNSRLTISLITHKARFNFCNRKTSLEPGGFHLPKLLLPATGTSNQPSIKQ